MTCPWVFPVPCLLPADNLRLRHRRFSASGSQHPTEQESGRNFIILIYFNRLIKQTRFSLH
ncbi:hypothetical protein DM784_08550 [Vibrio furnissii]|nr:hypothetical protein DM784_08550 [Vibrio furnissii]